MIILIISFLLNMITFMISFHLSEEIIDLEEKDVAKPTV